MILPQLQEALVVASDQMVARQRRRTQRFRLGLMTSAAVVTLGGGAVASQSLWAPLLGWEDGNRASLSREAPPTAQETRLAILRRDQTAADRGAAAQGVLKEMSGRYVGVKVADVRAVPDGRGSTTVLVPVAVAKGRTSGVRAKSAVATQTRSDVLCLHLVDDDPNASDQRQCFTTADVDRGAATLLAGATVRGIAPDGVARVRFTGAGQPARDVPVQDNLFVTSFMDLPGATRLSWVAADGRPVPFAGGATSRPIALPNLTPPLPRNLHDCGVAQGGVVPRTLSCGREARSYRPKRNEAQYFSRKP